MLNFTTTTIVNDANQFSIVDASGNAPAKLRVKNGTELNIPGITTVFLREATPAQLAKATVKIPTAAGTYRISIYVRISGSAQSTYANDWVFKGKPLYLGEFTVATGETGVREKILNTIRKHMTVMYGQNLLKITAGTNANEIVIEAKDQFQRFIDQDGNNSVKLQKLADTVGEYDYAKWEDVTDAGTVTIGSTGKEAFGDFYHLVKDLRLPTAENRSWYGTAIGGFMGDPDDAENDDRPIPGKTYDQYTITYEQDRGLGNGDVLGGLAKSRTVHVFYVDKTLSATFTENLEDAGLTVTPVVG